jgi:DNA-binding SARP family transcriptional activator
MRPQTGVLASFGGSRQDECGSESHAGLQEGMIGRVNDVASRGVSPREIVDLFPFGILVVGQDDTVVRTNHAAETLLGDALQGSERGELRCCDVFGCGRVGTPLERKCLAELARASRAALPEIRLDLGKAGEETAVWITAAPLRSETGSVVVHIRPGNPRDRRRRTNPHWIADRQLRILTLGRTRVDSGEGPLGGNWLGQRPGQLLKYLVTNRRSLVHPDQIAEALWPGSDQRVVGNVRHCVHALRDRLEPDRLKRAPSSFVISEHGGYRLDLNRISVDADEFEREVTAGMAAAERRELSAARPTLSAAMDLYRDDFLSDEPYAIWAIGERERLRALAAAALRLLDETESHHGTLDGATKWLERLAAMHPLDSGVERQLIALALHQGRHSIARRRYANFRMRILRELGQPPDFQLTDVASDVALGVTASLPGSSLT